jgi:hypothetical protein
MYSPNANRPVGRAAAAGTFRTVKDWFTMQKNFSTKPVKGPIFSGGKVVGTVQGATFRKTIDGTRHMLQKPNKAIAINVDALTQAEQQGAREIEVYDRETQTIYRATINHFKQRGFSVNRGYGLQLALTLEGWTRSRKGGGLEQLSLFEGAA